MAENNDSSLNFSIEDTMELGQGNKDLLNGLYETEVDPDKVTPITPVDDPDKKKTAPVVADEDDPDKKKPEETPPSNKSLLSFLDTEEEDPDGDPNPDEKKKEEEDPKGEEEEGQNSQFALLSRDLLKLGVFTTDEGEEEAAITTGQELLDRFNQEKRKGALEMIDNFIGQFGEDYREAFEAIYVKGADPKEYFGVYNTIVNFAELDLTKEANQIKVVEQMLADQGYETEDISTEVERLKNYGDLETVAAKHHKVLIKKQATKLKEIEENAQKELEQKKALRNQYIQNVQTLLQEKLKTKEFDGIPINPKLANELQDYLLVDKYKTASGELLTDFDKAILELKRPENHANKVKLALLLKIMEKDPTLSTIQKVGITKKTDKLFEDVVRQTSKQKTGNSDKPQGSWFK